MAQYRDIKVGPAPSIDGVQFYTDSWAVVIGLGEYRDSSIPRLQGAVPDADAVERALLELGFAPDHIFKRVNGEATKSEIERLFKRDLVRGTKSDDRVLFFFAGHGETHPAPGGDEGFLLPWDADPQSVPFTGLSMQEFRLMARRLHAKHVLLVADACYSGDFLTTRATARADADEGMLRLYLAERAIQVITAGTSRQRAEELDGHGILTRNFVSALRGAADESGTGWMTAMQLAAWVTLGVNRDSQGRQHPLYGSLEGNGQFVFVLPPRPRIFRPPVVEIVELTGSIELKSEIEGAVLLDRRPVGQRIRPGQAMRLRGVSVGSHEVMVRGEGGAAIEHVTVAPEVEAQVTLRRPAPKPGNVRVNPKDGQRYVWVPPGTFQMGCSPGDEEAPPDWIYSDREKPVHTVIITKGFWMGETPVSQLAYERVAGRNPSQFKGGDLPVETVTWEEARRFCEAVGMRLPTEAEWEWAARGGTGGARYGPLGDIAWYEDNSGGETKPVGQKQPNAFGLHDMLGNVWEWVADWYGPYTRTGQRDPLGPAGGDHRIARGGDWRDTPSYIRAPCRLSLYPASRWPRIGFRCAAEVLPE